METSTQGECHVKMKAEVQEMLLQTKECQRLPEIHQKLQERHGTVSPMQLSEGTNPADTLVLGFWPPEL